MKVKKSNKGLVVTIIILVILLLGTTGYIYYDKYYQKEEPQKEVVQKQEKNDFFSIDNLVEHKYIEKITDTKILENNDKTILKIENGNVYVAKNAVSENKKLIKNTTIEKPKSLAYITFQSISQNPYYVLTEDGNLYTGYIEINSEDEYGEFVSFRKINTQKIVDIYKFYDKGIDVYPWEPYTIFAATEDGKLLKVTDGKILATTFEEDFPYPDKICFDTPRGDAGCFGINISPDKKIYIEKNEETENPWEQIKYEDKDIIFKDIISDISLNENEDMSNKGNIYIIDNDNTIYTVPYKDFKFDTSKIISQKIKDYEITKDKKDYYYEVTGKVTFEDGATKTISGLLSSTFYYR